MDDDAIACTHFQKFTALHGKRQGKEKEEEEVERGDREREEQTRETKGVLKRGGKESE